MGLLRQLESDLKFILLKSVMIAALAGAVATLPIAIMFSFGMDPMLAIPTGLALVGYGVALSFLVGLPIALLVFQIVRHNQFFSIQNLFMIANGAAVCLTALAALFAGWMAVFLLGVPIFIAANIYATVGWRQVVEPYQVQLDD